MYYVGRNFPLLARVFSTDICTTSSCLQFILVTRSILLGMAVVLYRFIPFFISKYYQSNLAKEHQTTEAKLQLVPEWILAAESLTLLVEFDALYAVLVQSFFPVQTCSFSVLAIGAWVLWALFVVTYIFILYYTMNIHYWKNFSVNNRCIGSNLGAILVLAAFGMYLLSNDVIPLSCPRGANVVVAWIVMKVLVLIVVIAAIVLLLVYRCQPTFRQEKLLPRVLYQQLHPEPDEQNGLPLETVTSKENNI